jgi:glycosyltransferase involved in cell wall biosynthesis
MEALHAGVPVVASDVGGAREQLGEQGERGHLIRNPLGDPLNVNWKTMRSACYKRQANRAELVSAMSALVRDRAHWATKRDELAAESAQRFHPGRCARSHAALLHSLAAGRTAASHRGV